MKLFSCQYESEICLIIIMTTYDKPQQPKISILLSLQLQMAIIMDVVQREREIWYCVPTAHQLLKIIIKTLHGIKSSVIDNSFNCQFENFITFHCPWQMKLKHAGRREDYTSFIEDHSRLPWQCCARTNICNELLHICQLIRRLSCPGQPALPHKLVLHGQILPNNRKVVATGTKRNRLHRHRHLGAISAINLTEFVLRQSKIETGWRNCWFSESRHSE